MDFKTRIDVVKANVWVDVTGAPDTQMINFNGTLVPHTVALDYVQDIDTDEDGRTMYVWRCRRAEVSGNLLLKPGRNGERRFGKAVRSDTWFAKFARDLTDPAGHLYRPSPPAWLVELIQLARPSGEVRV